jgi:antitoxin VapB
MSESATEFGEEKKEIQAKLFWNGRSQAVRLPKEFRFEGDSVNIRRVDGGVLLESRPLSLRTKEEIRGWFAELDALRGEHLFPEPGPQPPAEERDPIL